jgi:hypothetical protein
MHVPSAARTDISGASALVGARDARLEAQRVVGDDFEARVLEPSPPAIVDGNWFADDPVAVDAPSRRPVVSPVGGGDLTWEAWLGDHPEHARWASERWLGAPRRLAPPPARLPATRLALHRVAVYVVSPARRRVNGKIALRWTCGGIGTPFFGRDEQVRVVATHLVRQQADRARVEPVTTLASAAAHALDGPPDVEWAEDFDVPSAGDPDEELQVDPEAAAFLGDWFGFAWSVLEAVRADPESIAGSRVQLWPEHFDTAFDCLPDAHRATFGASPGDASVEEPYLYVLPANLDAARPSDVWNADAFRGALLPLTGLVDAPDQRGTALAFFRRCRDELRTSVS